MQVCSDDSGGRVDGGDLSEEGSLFLGTELK